MPSDPTASRIGKRPDKSKSGITDTTESGQSDHVVIDLTDGHHPQEHGPPGPDGAVAGRPVVMLDEDGTHVVFQTLFGVGLTLAGCMTMVEPSVADRLALAVEEMDKVMAHLRAAAFRQAFPTITATDDDPDGFSTADEETRLMLNLLNRAARTASHLVEEAVAERTDASDLIEAAHCIYRALIILTSQATPALRIAGGER